MVFIHRSPRSRSTQACVRFIELLTPQSWDCGLGLWLWTVALDCGFGLWLWTVAFLCAGLHPTKRLFRAILAIVGIFRLSPHRSILRIDVSGLR